MRILRNGRAFSQRALMASAASLFVINAAQAQDTTRQGVPATSSDPEQSAPSNDEEGIIVTGTRLQINGYQQPTPVSVITAEKLERDNKTDLASVMATSPQSDPASPPTRGSAPSRSAPTPPG